MHLAKTKSGRKRGCDQGGQALSPGNSQSSTPAASAEPQAACAMLRQQLRTRPLAAGTIDSHQVIAAPTVGETPGLGQQLLALAH